jgi:hypothetical protein
MQRTGLLVKVIIASNPGHLKLKTWLSKATLSLKIIFESSTYLALCPSLHACFKAEWLHSPAKKTHVITFFLKNLCHHLTPAGFNVMITIFSNFCLFSAKNSNPLEYWNERYGDIYIYKRLIGSGLCLFSSRKFMQTSSIFPWQLCGDIKVFRLDHRHF